MSEQKNEIHERLKSYKFEANTLQVRIQTVVHPSPNLKSDKA